MRLIMAEPKKLSFNETLKAFGTVAITTYKASPLAAITKIIGTIIGSAIPLVAAFVAAQATLIWRLASPVTSKQAQGQFGVLQRLCCWEFL